MIDVIVVQTEIERQQAFTIRQTVFVGEQGVPAELELDEYDATATHVLALQDGRPVGAGRFRLVDNYVKVERICVLSTERGKKIGEAIMACIEREGQKLAPTAVLNAQVQAFNFYDRLGYHQVGERFVEAGIDHVKMKKHLA